MPVHKCAAMFFRKLNQLECEVRKVGREALRARDIRCRTLPKVDSMGLVVRKCCQCLAEGHEGTGKFASLLGHVPFEDGLLVIDGAPA